MTPSASHCPIAGCFTAINTLRYVMCGRHWAMVPKALAAEVYRAWESRQRRCSTAAIERHEAAKRAAIEAVDALLAGARA